MNFVFYDTETTGTQTAFDQILQFAAIRTDRDLRELDRFEIRCRLLPNVAPSPGAMRVTGVSVEQLTDASLPSHYQMVRAIKAKLEEWSPAVFIGHNSIAFDENLLRQAFYKTLHPPYLTNTKGNHRMDSLRILQAVDLFAPETFSTPVGENDKPTFRLDLLAPANGFDHRAAHDAMGDVEATIHMCRILAERAGGLWSHFTRHAQKAAVLDFAATEEVFLLSDFYFGEPYCWMVTAIGPNPDNGSEILVYDLSIDPDEIAGLDDEALAARQASPLKPVRGMRANAAPVFLPCAETPDRLSARMADVSLLRERAARLKSIPGLADRLIAAFVGKREPRDPSPHVEEQIYDSFTSGGDTRILSRFHATDWAGRADLLAQLEDRRLVCLGERLIHTEAPEVMDRRAREALDGETAKRLLASDDGVPWLTLPRAIAEAEDMLASASGAEAARLRDLKRYLDDWVERLRRASASRR